MGEYTYLRRDYDQYNWTKIEDCDAERYITNNHAMYGQGTFVETYPTHAARCFDLIVRIFSKETEEVEVKGAHSDGVT